MLHPAEPANPAGFFMPVFFRKHNKTLNVDNFFAKLLVTCAQLDSWKNPVDSVDKSNPLSTWLSTSANPCGYCVSASFEHFHSAYY